MAYTGLTHDPPSYISDMLRVYCMATPGYKTILTLMVTFKDIFVMLNTRSSFTCLLIQFWGNNFKMWH